MPQIRGLHVSIKNVATSILPTIVSLSVSQNAIIQCIKTGRTVGTELIKGMEFFNPTSAVFRNKYDPRKKTVCLI